MMAVELSGSVALADPAGETATRPNASVTTIDAIVPARARFIAGEGCIHIRSVISPPLRVESLDRPIAI
jgi:hypothetical protein